MKAIANNNNSTLRITKGKEYDIYFYEDRELVSVVNDINDEIVISSHAFDWEE